MSPDKDFQEISQIINALTPNQVAALTRINPSQMGTLDQLDIQFFTAKALVELNLWEAEIIGRAYSYAYTKLGARVHNVLNDPYSMVPRSKFPDAREVM